MFMVVLATVMLAVTYLDYLKNCYMMFCRLTATSMTPHSTTHACVFTLSRCDACGLGGRAIRVFTGTSVDGDMNFIKAQYLKACAE